MILTAHQPQYLPGLRLMHKLASADAFVLLDHLPHQHNSFENRNKIRTRQGWQWLTVPVTHSRKRLRDVSLPQGVWIGKHLRAIYMNYQRAGFFWQHVDMVDNWYGSPDPMRTLASAGESTTWSLSGRLTVRPKIVGRSTLAPEVSAQPYDTHVDIYGLEVRTSPPTSEPERRPRAYGWRMLLDLCRTYNADTFLFGAQGRNYMDDEARAAFRRAGVKPLFQVYDPQPYRQVYDPFIPDMSALDVLLNEGPARGREVIMAGGRWEE